MFFGKLYMMLVCCICVCTFEWIFIEKCTTYCCHRIATCVVENRVHCFGGEIINNIAFGQSLVSQLDSSRRLRVCSMPLVLQSGKTFKMIWWHPSRALFFQFVESTRRPISTEVAPPDCQNGLKARRFSISFNEFDQGFAGASACLDGVYIAHKCLSQTNCLQQVLRSTFINLASLFQPQCKDAKLVKASPRGADDNDDDVDEGVPTWVAIILVAMMMKMLTMAMTMMTWPSSRAKQQVFVFVSGLPWGSLDHF